MYNLKNIQVIGLQIYIKKMGSLMTTQNFSKFLMCYFIISNSSASGIIAKPQLFR